MPEIDAATDSDADRFIGAASPSNGSDSTPPPAIAEPSESEEKPSHLTAWLFFGIGMPAVYLLLLLIIQPLFRRYRYRRTDEAGRLSMELADVLWLIRRLCPDTGSNRPLLDYASLLKDPADAADMKRLCLAYYRFRYGGGSAELQQTSIRLRQSLYFQYINSSRHGRPLRRLSACTNLSHLPK